jgi:perosamine synthetase
MPSASFQTDDLIAAIRRALPGAAGRVELHEPEFTGREGEYVAECLASGWVSYLGAFVDRFERELAAVCGVRNALTLVNGTAALHAALLGLGVAPGDEVIIPSLTFVATANAVHHAGAVPHLVDCEAATLGIDIARLAEHLERIAIVEGEFCRNRRTGRRIAAVVPVHVLGHPIDGDALASVAARFVLPVLADATESLGSTWRDRPAASYGHAGVLSFNGNKIITTGGGGAIVTDDDALAARLRHLCTTAKQPHPWHFFHDQPAFNYRMPNLNAALGCAQLERLPQFVAEKRRLADSYRDALAPLTGIEVIRETAAARSNYWLCAIKLAPEIAAQRDAILAALHLAGLKCRPLWAPMHQLAMYAECPRMDDLSCTEAMYGRIICLPSTPRLAR